MSTRGRLQRRRPPGAARQPSAPTLEGAFRTPTLRCAAAQPSFMHTGTDHARWLRSSRSSIAAAIRPAAIPGTSELHALGLTERERADLVAFMGALAGPGSGRRAAGGAMRSVRALRRSCRRGRRPARARVRLWRAAGATTRPALRRRRAARRPVRPPGRFRRRTSRSREPAASTRPPSATRSRAGRRRAAAPASSIPRAGASSRGAPYDSSSFDDAFRIGPALIGACRADLSTRACCPTRTCSSAIRPRRSPAATCWRPPPRRTTASTTYRIRQPFDFAGRTGTIKLDIDAHQQRARRLAGADHRAGSVARAQLRLARARLRSAQRHRDRVRHRLVQHAPARSRSVVYTFADYVQTAFVPSFDCAIPHATTAPGALNHVEVYVTADHVEVWASDTSPDGVTLPQPAAAVGGRRRAAVLAAATSASRVRTTRR